MNKKHLTFAFCCAILVSFLNACVQTPSGKNALLLTSKSQERKLGSDGYKEVLQEATLNKDPVLNAMLQRVGRAVAATTGERYAWQFSLIESNDVNAWAMPGGKVAFYTGILPYLQNEGGMAVVMGHEVAHATLRHSGQRISQNMLMQLGLSAASLSLSNNRQHDTLMGLMGAGAQFGVVLPYGRKHESEADIIGIKYMAKAGYDPRESIPFWTRFSKAGGQAPPEFLSTHPSGATRIRDLRKAMPEATRLYAASRAKKGTGQVISLSGIQTAPSTATQRRR